MNDLSLFDTTPCANGDRALAAAEAGDPTSVRRVKAWCASCPITELCAEILGGPVITESASVTVLPGRSGRATETTLREVAA